MPSSGIWWRPARALLNLAFASFLECPKAYSLGCFSHFANDFLSRLPPAATAPFQVSWVTMALNCCDNFATTVSQ